ncbi:alcohol dehydrogenase catalytic domain-containing protein [Leucobacter tenebrionis]|uniref:alcohol dehydrogenase catalytic domain-containing protein n=1 Tax=Leucobacter tenebrionis TaxID=2873270 RepID=UPI001CA7B5D6|nr:alcohol dehydrogenase catalytic domain-containing protein [Leucobacter tenebrionis]QZY50922.1 alcohol dehydrogenase catalytic domain-containing protein [Leucobacter tenebrionis]
MSVGAEAMRETMRAVRYYGPGDVRVERLEKPVPSKHQVLIRNELCGICGTDLHEYTEGPIFAPTADVPDPLTGETAPVVLGHEMVGVIESVGSEVSRFSKGQRVAVEPRQACGECGPCLDGRRNCCPIAATIGLQGGGGGLADYIAVDEQLVYDLGSIPAEVGVALEPLAVATHAVRRIEGGVHGKQVLVMGAGPIGALVVWVLRASGASEVVVVEPGAGRRENALKFGATRLLDPKQDDLEKKLTEWGISPHAAFECAGTGATLQGCLQAVRPGGVVVNVAISGRAVEVDLLPLIVKEISVLGSICYAGDHAAAIELLRENEFPVEAFVSERIRLEDVVAEGLEELRRASAEHMKIVVAV